MARVTRALVLVLVLFATPSAFPIPPNNCFSKDIQRTLVCGAICQYSDAGPYCKQSTINPRPGYCYRVLDVTPTTCHEGQYDQCCEGTGTGF